jgi:acyl-CoA thioester hydrolase
MKFEKKFEVKWADLDPNGHVRHSAYYDYGGYIRIRFISESGYGQKKLAELKLGPILFKEECHFIKEIGMGDVLRVNILKGEISSDCSRWIVHHEIFSQDEQKVAHITAQGAWLNTEKRILTSPPTDLAKAFHRLPPGEGFNYKRFIANE